MILEFRILVISCFIFMNLVFESESTIAAEKPGYVSLFLEKCTVVDDGQNLDIKCYITIDNDTTDEITVISQYHSVFDGLDLVVTDEDGKTLIQQAYIHIHSIYKFKGRPFILKKGKTSEGLSFVLFHRGNLEKKLSHVKVRLVGTLPKSAYKDIISTDTIRVEVEKKNKTPAPLKLKQPVSEPKNQR